MREIATDRRRFIPPLQEHNMSETYNNLTQKPQDMLPSQKRPVRLQHLRPKCPNLNPKRA